MSTTGQLLNLVDLEVWVREIELRCNRETTVLRGLSEESLVPIFDVMIQMFEEQIESFIEQNNLSMKEL